MKFNKLSKTLSMTALTAAMAVAPAINVFAAPEDIIDTTKKASLTIHKYDMTAAQQDGINVDEFKEMQTVSRTQLQKQHLQIT